MKCPNGLGVSTLLLATDGFIINTLLGFELGSTVISKTRGIWVWVRPHPNRPDCCLVLLDTEGLADAKKVAKIP